MKIYFEKEAHNDESIDYSILMLNSSIEALPRRETALSFKKLEFSAIQYKSLCEFFKL